MNKYLRAFLQRGLAFSGFGPIVAGIVFLILSYTVEDFSLTASQVLLAIVSTYILAFIQAGASVFPHIEGWSVPKSLLCHLGLVYIAYVACYLVNSWIPFDPWVILIFTGIFVGVFLLEWLIVFLTVKAVSKKLNAKLRG